MLKRTLNVLINTNRSALGIFFIVSAALFTFCSPLSAQVIDLNEWRVEGNPANGDWRVSDDGTSVLQNVNGAPTFFVSPDTFINTSFVGKISVDTAADDDFIGFVMGFNRPVGNESYFQFILLDWKMANQNAGGRLAQEGFTLARVDGEVTGNLQTGATAYWNHTDPAVEVLATDYGNDKGWQRFTQYEFEIVYFENRIQVIVEADTIFDVSGTFAPGRFGFYNYSQLGVNYRSFEMLNQPPLAVDDMLTSAQNTPGSIFPLRNDSDPNNDNLQISSFEQAANGTVSQINDSTLNYLPNPEFFGGDSFRYGVSDSFGGTDTATVFIEVLPVLDAPLGKALLFDGSEDFVSAPFDYSGPFTVELWAQASSVNQPEFTSVFSSSYPGNKIRFFQVNFDNSSNYRLNIGDETFALNIAKASTDFQHLAITYDGASTVKAYLNGVLQNTGTWTGDPIRFEAVKVASNRDEDKLFNGVIDEVRVWTVERRASQIQTTMNDTLTADYYATADSGLAVYYRFESLEDLGVENDGADDVRDLSVNQRHGDTRGNPTLVPADVDSGLVAYFPFNGNANDESGNGNHGSLNGPVLTTDRFGNPASAYDFDGIDDFISVPLNINPGNMPQLTMAAWVNPDKKFSGTVISHDNRDFDRGIDIDNRGGGDGWSAFSGSGRVLGFHPVIIGEWVFLAVVYDQPNAQVTLYVKYANDEGKYQGNGVLGNGWDFLHIGSNPSFAAHIDGKIDDVFIYNRLLSDIEIQQLYLSGLDETNRPVAVNDAGETTLNTPVAVNVLANDFHTLDSPIFIVETSQPLYGSAVQTGDSVITYTPGFGFFGADTFQYVISDPAGNRDTAAVTITIPTPLPDLKVASVQAPPNASSGQPIQVDWIVNNIGNDGTKSPEWRDAIYLSSSETFDASTTTLLGRVENFSALNVNDGYANKATYTLPRGISGDYYIFVRTDVFNREQEADESNNLAHSDLMQVVLSPYANLQVTDVSLPATVSAGDSMTITWTVRNNGTGRTEVDEWYDTIFLSDDDSLNFGFFGNDKIFVNETVLASPVRYSGVLEKDASYTRFVRIRSPHTLSDTMYIFVYTDIRGGSPQFERGAVYEYEFETDNSERDSVNFVISQAPDLVVTNASAPNAASLGEQISVQWSVQNQGTGATFESNWQDRAWLSRSSVFDPDSTISLGLFSRNGILARDSSYAANRGVRIPSGFTGENYIFVETDAGNRVFEHTFEGNNVPPVGEPITISNPNLAVDSIAVPAEAGSGKSFEVSWTVRNLGAGAVFNHAWNDRVFLSRPAVFDPDSASVLGSLSRSGALLPDSTYTARASFTLPNGVSGDYYIFVQTDWNGQVFEPGGEGDNRDRSLTPMRVNLSPWPDLQVVAAPEAGNFTAGDRVPVTWTVKNEGVAATQSGAWTDRIYLSPGSEFDPANAVLLANVDRNRALDPGASYTQSRTITLAANLSGTFCLAIVTDANNNVYEHTDEGNNLLHSEVIEIAPYPPIDLALIGELSAPDSALSGAKIPATWRVENLGEGATLTTFWTDRVWLSADTILDVGGDVRIASVGRSGALRPGEHYDRNRQITLGNDVAGDFYMIVEIDAGQAVSDVDRGNNVSVSQTQIHLTLAPTPDLVAAAFTLPDSAAAGQPLMVNYRIENQGEIAAAGRTWFDAVYLSRNAALDPGDKVLATRRRELNLPVAGAYSDSLEVELPGYISGNYFLIVKTDSRNDIFERNGEDNNVRLGGTSIDSMEVTPIVVIQPDPADLIVSEVTVPATAVPGQEATIAFSLKNIGENRARGRLRTAVYISPDSLWEVEDPLFGVLTHNIDLPPDSATNISMKINLAKAFRADAEGNVTEELPGLTPGVYHAIVRTDIRRNIRESNPSNNRLTSTDLMTTDVPELQLGVPETGTLAGGETKFYRLQSVEAGATIQIDLTSGDSTAFNELYVAFERTPTLNDFDFAAAEPYKANQRVVIPSSASGEYFLMLNSRASGSSNQFTLLADSLEFALHSVETNVGGNTGIVTVEITGAKFDTLMIVHLETVSDTIPSVSTIFIDPTKVYATFNLIGVAPEIYDVVVINEDSSQAITPGGFEVVPGSEPSLVVEIDHPPILREGSVSLIQVRFRNVGDIDINQELYIESSNGHPISLTLNGLSGSNTGIYVPVAEKSGYPSPNLRPGASGSVEIHVLARTTGANISTRPRSINQAILPLLFRIYSIYKQARRLIIPAIKFTKDIVCKAHLDRNFHNQEAKGKLTKVNAEVDISSYSSVIKLPGPLTPGLDNLRQHRYYKDENGAVWTLLSAWESKEHCETDDCSDAVKLVRADPSNGVSSFETVRLLLPGETRTSKCFANKNNLRTGSKQQTYNFIDHRWGPIGHSREDIVPHFICGSNYTTPTDIVYAQPTSEDSSRCDPTAESPTDESEIPIVRAVDPNDITGPAGEGDARWITATETLPYLIRFENDSTKATAAAQVVTVTQKLDSTLDVRSFRLGSFGFSNHTFAVPENRAFYSTRLDVRDSLGVFVDFTAGIDLNKNEAFWTFRAVDPATGQLPVFEGFLPVNDPEHRGEGFVNYSIRPQAASQTGDVVHAQARIVFDSNEPLDTPEIFNTIDAVIPYSQIAALPAALDSTTFTLHWSGMDDSTGSQIRGFDVYVSENDEPFAVLESSLLDTSLVFSGDYGSAYSFFTLASDLAGNIEPLKTAPDARVILDSTATSVANGGGEMPKTFALYQNYPNPFNPTTTFKYDLPTASEVKLVIFNILGQKVRTLVDKTQAAGAHTIQWDGRNESGVQVASGAFIYRLEAGDPASAKRRFVRSRKMLLLR